MPFVLAILEFGSACLRPIDWSRLLPPEVWDFEFFNWTLGVGVLFTVFFLCSFDVLRFLSHREVFVFLSFSHRTGNNGKGAPVFTGEVDCTYFFTWGTEHACVKEKEDLLCGVSDGKKQYDLSVLARHSGVCPGLGGVKAMCWGE